MGISLPWLPASILYSQIADFDSFLFFVLQLAAISKYGNGKKLIFSHWNLLLTYLTHHCPCTCHGLLYPFLCQSLLTLVCCYFCVPLLKWLVLPPLLQSFLNAGHLQGLSIVLQYLHFYVGLFCIFVGCFVITNLVCLYKLSNDWAYCSYTSVCVNMCVSISHWSC